MNENILKKYARLAIYSGINVQPGQLLIINANVRDYQFVEYCVEYAYQKGAGSVVVKWGNENTSHMAYQYESLESLSEVADWEVERVKYEHEKGACYFYEPTSWL